MQNVWLFKLNIDRMEKYHGSYYVDNLTFRSVCLIINRTLRVEHETIQSGRRSVKIATMVIECSQL